MLVLHTGDVPAGYRSLLPFLLMTSLGDRSVSEITVSVSKTDMSIS